MTYTQKQLIARIERQIDINATIIERLGDDSAAASELAVETATMDIKILDVALAALENCADAELAEIDERAAFNAWNNDTDCPLAGRDAKSAAWLAWSRRAALLAAAPQQEAQEVKK